MKKIIIDGRERSIEEVINTQKIYYAAKGFEEIFEPKAREIADNACAESDLDVFAMLTGEWEMLFLKVYLENAENDLVINSDEVAELQRQKEEEDERRREQIFYEEYTLRGL